MNLFKMALRELSATYGTSALKQGIDKVASTGKRWGAFGLFGLGEVISMGSAAAAEKPGKSANNNYNQNVTVQQDTTHKKAVTKKTNITYGNKDQKPDVRVSNSVSVSQNASANGAAQGQTGPVYNKPVPQVNLRSGNPGAKATVKTKATGTHHRRKTVKKTKKTTPLPKKQVPAAPKAAVNPIPGLQKSINKILTKLNVDIKLDYKQGLDLAALKNSVAELNGKTDSVGGALNKLGTKIDLLAAAVQANANQNVTVHTDVAVTGVGAAKETPKAESHPLTVLAGGVSRTYFGNNENRYNGKAQNGIEAALEYEFIGADKEDGVSANLELVGRLFNLNVMEGTSRDQDCGCANMFAANPGSGFNNTEVQAAAQVAYKKTFAKHAKMKVGVAAGVRGVSRFDLVNINSDLKDLTPDQKMQQQTLKTFEELRFELMAPIGSNKKSPNKGFALFVRGAVGLEQSKAFLEATHDKNGNYTAAEGKKHFGGNSAYYQVDAGAKYTF